MSQALFTSAGSGMAAVAGLAGLMLATDKSLATLPVSTMWIGTAMTTLPASLLMRWYGRRTGFMLGGLFGVGGALVAARALSLGNFWLFAFGTFLIGAWVAHAQLYRLAAADTATLEFRPRAISLVLAGGVIAGYFGPQIAKWSVDWVPETLYMGSYYAVAILAGLSIVMLTQIDIPRPTPDEVRGEVRPLRKIVAQPALIVAVLAAMVGYGVMNLLMTGTPLAMVGHHHPFSDAATVIQWHVVAMFLPSFFTGSIINRFGVLPVILVGALLDFLAIGAALAGASFLNFWVGLVLLGVGWNFMFIGGSTLLTTTYSTAERPKTQGLNEFLVFGTAVTASLMSGQVLHYLGWSTVLMMALPFLTLATGATLWLAWRQRHGAVT